VTDTYVRLDLDRDDPQRRRNGTHPNVDLELDPPRTRRQYRYDLLAALIGGLCLAILSGLGVWKLIELVIRAL
jgi:hypothetical protein